MCRIQRKWNREALEKSGGKKKVLMKVEVAVDSG